MCTEEEKCERSARVYWMGALSWVLLTPAVGLACEACKEAVKNDPVGTALSATTLVLIGMPMVLIGSIGGWIGYAYWRAARRVAHEAPSEIVSEPV